MKCINVFLLALFFICKSFISYSQQYIVTEHGVGTDSTQISTTALQAVIDKAEAAGGGTIVIPKGVYLSGALFFKPKTKLALLSGAVLKGSDNIDNYPLIPSRMEGRSIYYYAALINAYNVDSFTITGPGIIDGNGLLFWKKFWAYRDAMREVGKEATNLDVHRPRLVFIWGSDQVKIKNVTLQNSGFWTTHLYQCNDVLIEDCKILSPYKPVPAPSTDGIDIDVCKRVTVRRCFITVNDDAVCIKGGKGPTAHQLPENGIVEDVLIEDCVFGESHGTLTLGSESIHARNITLRNCTVDNNNSILRLKMRPDTYQLFENILVENITGKSGPVISMNPWKQFFDLGGSTEKPSAIVRNITFKNISVQCSRFGEMNGNPNDRVSNILFTNINITTATPELKTTYTDHITFKNVVVNGNTVKLN